MVETCKRKNGATREKLDTRQLRELVRLLDRSTDTARRAVEVGSIGSKLVAQEAHVGLCLQSASCAAVQTVCSEATRVQDLAISGAWRSTDRSLQ